MTDKNNESLFFGIHFDLHANQNDKELGKGLSVEHLVKELSKINPDFVQCDCKGHLGYASYPTKVGIAAPGIVKDSLRIWRDATRKMNIPLIVHFSGIWDTQALSKHRNWARVNSPKANKRGFPNLQMDEQNRDFNMVCPNREYTDKYMIKQMEEIIEEYDVDGFWVDGENWAVTPCYCDTCKKMFTKETQITTYPESKEDEGWDEWIDFHKKSFEDHVRRFTEAVHKKKPNCTVCSNWMYTVREPDEVKVQVDYISGDFDYRWSLQRANVEARYMDTREMPWNLMAWGFTSFGPMKHWVFKTSAAMCQEASVVLSNAGAFMPYDQPERTGDLVSWHMDRISEVARFCRARKDYCINTTSVPQVAVLHSKKHYYKNNVSLYNFGDAIDPLDGALRLLLENHMHVDILSEHDLEEKINRYPLWIIPDQNDMDIKECEIYKKYVKKGGKLIVSGQHLSKKFDDISDVSDLDKVAGEGTDTELYIPLENETICVAGAWRLVDAKKENVLIPLYLSRQLKENIKVSNSPAISITKYGKGKIINIFGDFFNIYNKTQYPQYRKLLKNIIDSLEIDNLIKVEAPPHVSITLREKEDKLFINLVNQGSDHPLSKVNAYIENVPPTGPIDISLMVDNKPKRVSLLPGANPIRWTYDGKYVNIHIKKIDIHEIVIIE